MLWQVLNAAGLALIAAALAAVALKRLASYQAAGLLSLSQVLMGVGGFLGGHTVIASISAAAAAYLAWHWWNGGGGDDTKRRRRSMARRFRGTRRTAPAGAQ